MRRVSSTTWRSGRRRDAHGDLAAARAAQDDAGADVGAVRAERAVRRTQRAARASPWSSRRRTPRSAARRRALPSSQCTVGHLILPSVRSARRGSRAARGRARRAGRRRARRTRSGRRRRRAAARRGRARPARASRASTRRSKPVQPVGRLARERVGGRRRAAERRARRGRARRPSGGRRRAGARRASLPWAALWRSIAISGTSPEPPPTSSSGPPSSTRQVKWPPTGPRSSSSSPARSSLGQVGRDLAVVDALDGQLEPRVLGGGGDRVGALRLVAVLGGQAHVDVLAGDVAGPAGDVEHDRARAARSRR